MRVHCIYCRNWVYSTEPDFHAGKTKTCDTCQEQVTKLDEKTVDWLMRVIDGRVETALDEHTNRYSHEPSSYGAF